MKSKGLYVNRQWELVRNGQALINFSFMRLVHEEFVTLHMVLSESRILYDSVPPNFMAHYSQYLPLKHTLW